RSAPTPPVTGRGSPRAASPPWRWRPPGTASANPPTTQAPPAAGWPCRMGPLRSPVLRRDRLTGSAAGRLIARLVVQRRVVVNDLGDRHRRRGVHLSLRMRAAAELGVHNAAVGRGDLVRAH